MIYRAQQLVKQLCSKKFNLESSYYSVERIQIIPIDGFIYTLTIFGAQQHYNLPTKIVISQLDPARFNLISAGGIKNVLKYRCFV